MNTIFAQRRARLLAMKALRDSYIPAEQAARCPACGAQAQREWAGEMFSATGKPAKKCSGHCATCSGCK